MSYLPAPPAFHSDADGVTVHQLLLAADDAHSALDAVRQGLADSGAELCNLTLKPVGQIVEASLRVRRLGDQAARRLRSRPRRLARRQLGQRRASVGATVTDRKPDEDKRRLFLVTAEDTPDALMRVLGVASVQQTRLRALTATPDGQTLAIRLEIDDQGDDRAQSLASRLAACPSVRGVGFGWRA